MIYYKAAPNIFRNAMEHAMMQKNFDFMKLLKSATKLIETFRNKKKERNFLLGMTESLSRKARVQHH